MKYKTKKRQKSSRETTVSSLNNHKQKTFQLMTELHSKPSLREISHQKRQTEQAHPWKPTVLAETGGGKNGMQLFRTSVSYTEKIHVDKVKLAF